MTRNARPVKGELVPFGKGSLRPEPVVLYLTPRIIGYARALMRTGFYGATVPEVCERLVWRGIEEAIAKGIIAGKAEVKK